MKLLVSPHNDDECLWCSFTIIRERPRVLVVYDSFVQSARGIPGCDEYTRRNETFDAHGELLEYADPPIFLGFPDNAPYPSNQISAQIASCIMLLPEAVTDIWAPSYEEGGHEQHNLVALACNAFEGTCNVHRYLTYTRTGGKSTPETHHQWTDASFGGMTNSLFCTICERDREHWVHHYDAVEVAPPSAEAIARKLRALACFKSQMQLDPRLGTAEWFYGNDLREYMLLPPAKAEREQYAPSVGPGGKE